MKNLYCRLFSPVFAAIAVSLLAQVAIAATEGHDTIAGPHVTSISPVSADTLAVTIRHGRVTAGRQEPYVGQRADQLKPWRYHNWLERDGKTSGRSPASSRMCCTSPQA